jgi:hypothetical protein
MSIRNHKWLVGILCLLVSATSLAQSTGPIAPPSGFGVMVSVNQSEYWTDFMPPGVRPPTIRMSLTVFNNSNTAVRFAFPSSQRFDFSIYDSNGTPVWRWSDGRAFLSVVGYLTLQPGQSVTFPYEHKFANQDGSPLAQGLYTLKGELVARDSATWQRRPMEGIVSFKHSHVY